MTEGPEPTFRTGWLWIVLTFLLMVGTVSAAFFVYGLTDLLGSGRWFPDLVILFVGAALATFVMLLITGILYRVDRLRGVPHKPVRIFD